MLDKIILCFRKQNARQKVVPSIIEFTFIYTNLKVDNDTSITEETKKEEIGDG